MFVLLGVMSSCGLHFAVLYEMHISCIKFTVYKLLMDFAQNLEFKFSWPRKVPN